MSNNRLLTLEEIRKRAGNPKRLDNTNDLDKLVGRAIFSFCSDPCLYEGKFGKKDLFLEGNKTQIELIAVDRRAIESVNGSIFIHPKGSKPIAIYVGPYENSSNLEDVYMYQMLMERLKAAGIYK